MSGSHGDLFHEIGRLVLAAHAGQAIDLSAKSEELARRYGHLDVPADLIAKAIARALSAISVSMAIVSERPRVNGGANGHALNGHNGHDRHDGSNGHAHANGESSGGTAELNGSNGDGPANGVSPVDAADDEEMLDDAALETQAEAASALFPSGLRLAVLN